RDVVEHLSGGKPLRLAVPGPTETDESASACMSQVRGQADARRALEIAACGGHSLLLSGPPGVGKSMLAHRLPGLLPPLERRQFLEVAALTSVGGREPRFTLTAPFRAPHHSASMPALVGGGMRP